jgi:SOS response regulatory protein OraA/RecX
MQAYKRAIHLLSIKARFRKELEERLRQEGYPDPEIAQALEKCSRYLDDEALARSKIRVQARKGYGSRRISASLQRYTSSQEVLQEVDERETLLTYLKKHPKLLVDPKAKLRLLRRGFSFEMIDEVLKLSSDDL